jgi:hypothetical protein
MQKSAMCQQVQEVVQRLVSKKQNFVWNVFDADHPDVGMASPNDRTVFIRFHPMNHHYVYDLIVVPPLQGTLEQDIQAFIERNIPG